MFVKNEDSSMSSRSTCKSCGKEYEYHISDRAAYGGHDSDTIICPWCGNIDGEVHGGDSIMVTTMKIK